MKFLVKQSTATRNIAGPGVKVDTQGQITMDSVNSVLMPRGVTADRPWYPEEGHIRYNTETDQMEVFQGTGWRNIRYKEPTKIVWQNLGTGDALEVAFGPLDSGDQFAPVPIAAENVIVLVENVVQLPITNYRLVQNPAGNSPSSGNPYAPGWYILFTSAIPLGKPVTVAHNFDK